MVAGTRNIASVTKDLDFNFSTGRGILGEGRFEIESQVAQVSHKLST